MWIGAAGRLWQWSRASLAPFGELGCALLFELSLADRLGVSIRLATEDDLDVICPLYLVDSWLWLGDRHHYRDRLRRGERCYLGFVGDNLAHVNWTCVWPAPISDTSR